MKRLKTRCEAEITEKKSRFIAIALPIRSLDEVKAAVKAVWKEHPDATHVVHAAVAGASGTLFSCSDDREPKNTAGRPALEVLKGSGITDILVCIVRYFGGTLLGTGGLVKAYSDSVKEVLKKAETEEIIARTGFCILTGYEYYDKLRHALASFDITQLNENFLEGITITGRLASDEKDSFEKTFSQVTMGRARLTFSSGE